MDANYFAALIGVLGTLFGTVAGWFLSLQSYKIGRTVIHGKLIVNHNILPDKNETVYLVRCVVHNSRQIPVILDDFRLEKKTCNPTVTTIMRIVEPDVKYHDINGIKIGAELALKPLFIEPRTLQEFSFRIPEADCNITKCKLTLIAYDEKHKKQKFKIYDGRRNVS